MGMSCSLPSPKRSASPLVKTNRGGIFAGRCVAVWLILGCPKVEEMAMLDGELRCDHLRPQLAEMRLRVARAADALRKYDGDGLEMDELFQLRSIAKGLVIVDNRLKRLEALLHERMSFGVPYIRKRR